MDIARFSVRRRDDDDLATVLEIVEANMMMNEAGHQQTLVPPFELPGSSGCWHLCRGVKDHISPIAKLLPQQNSRTLRGNCHLPAVM